MRLLLFILLVGAALIFGFVGLRVWQWHKQWPEASTETVQLTPNKRAVLQQLRAERKFQPHDYPPLGYTGTDSPEDAVVATKAVDDVIDAILARPDGTLPAKMISDLFSKNLKRVRGLATEDRERAQDYMVEIWYLLGFKGATGRFAYGSAYSVPPGYGEPLPPGWKSPTAPRPIG